MRIKRVFAEKLFNLFDHNIPMKMDDRITIIHAPNGFGKTAILRMIEGLFNSRYSELRAVFRDRYSGDSIPGTVYWFSRPAHQKLVWCPPTIGSRSVWMFPSFWIQ